MSSYHKAAVCSLAFIAAIEITVVCPAVSGEFQEEAANDTAEKYVDQTIDAARKVLGQIRPETWNEIDDATMYGRLNSRAPGTLMPALLELFLIHGYSDFLPEWFDLGEECRPARVEILALVDCYEADGNKPDYVGDSRRFEPGERAQREEEIKLVRTHRVRLAQAFYRALSKNKSKSPKVKELMAHFKKAAEGIGEGPKVGENRGIQMPEIDPGDAAITPKADMKKLAEQVIAAAQCLATLDPDAAVKDLSQRMMSKDSAVSTPALIEACLRISPVSEVSKFKWEMCRDSERPTRMTIIALRECLTTDLPLPCFDGSPERFAAAEQLHRQEEIAFVRLNRQMFAHVIYQELAKNQSKSPKVRELMDRFREVAGVKPEIEPGTNNSN